MAGREETQSWVSGDDPVAVVLASECVEAGALGHVPDADRLVLGVAQNELLLRVEDGARDVVVVAAASVDFPCLGFCESKRSSCETKYFKDAVPGNRPFLHEFTENTLFKVF